MARCCSDPDPEERVSLPWLTHHAFNTMAYYLLDRTTPVRVLHGEWLNWFTTDDHHIAESMREGCRISTIFLGIGYPSFETMLFWEGHDCHEAQGRWTTYQEAVEGHFGIVAELEAIQAGKLPWNVFALEDDEDAP